MNKSDIIYNEIKDKAEKLSAEIIDIRRKIHSNPEIMFREKKTAELIREYLKSPDVEIRSPYIAGGTDTVCVIRGKHGGPGQGRTVLLRADIDALNIAETGEREWISKTPGLAHSCGHDGHTAILLGAVKLLAGMRERFSGNIKAVFQPAEEGGGGGEILVKKGILDDEPRVDEVYALHGWPGVEEGCFESCPGAMMAAVDNFTIEVSGKGGHAAMPHLCSDPVLSAAQIIVNLQAVVSRNIDPIDSAVITVCTINGGELNNVIPESVVMKGTARYFRKETGIFVRQRIEEILKGISAANRTLYRLDYRKSYIPLFNTPQKVKSAGDAVISCFGSSFWSDSAPLTTGGEDFSYYLEKRPGAFLRLGLGKSSPPLHSSFFDFNDNVIAAGIAAMSAIALNAVVFDAGK